MAPNGSLEQILDIERGPSCNVPDTGLLCDFLWADPDPDLGGWAENARGVSYTFGQDVVDEFLEKFDFDLIVRAHQVVEDGYEFFAGRQLVTLFSAPNYCGEFDNNAAIMTVSMIKSSILPEVPQSIHLGFSFVSLFYSCFWLVSAIAGQRGTCVLVQNSETRL